MAGRLLKGARKCLYALEKRTNPQYVEFDAVQSLGATDAKVLLIASDNDTVVRKEHHFEVLQRALGGKENIRFLLTEGKGHNPSYTCDAVCCKDAFFAEFQRRVKKKQLETPAQQKVFMDTFDWYRMTEQDEVVWEAIVQHLES